MRKRLAAVFVTLVCARVLFGAEFSKGDSVKLTRDEPLYFNNGVFRNGNKGETFTVYARDPIAHKVYFVVKDGKGKPIGLNVKEDALVLASRRIAALPLAASTPSPAIPALETKDKSDSLSLPTRVDTEIGGKEAIERAKDFVQENRASVLLAGVSNLPELIVTK